MREQMRLDVVTELDQLRRQGMMKEERRIGSPQSARVSTGAGPVLNFCSNDYLGLANHPSIRLAAKSALDRWGFGMASVRFICGTQDQHIELERLMSSFLGTDDTILFSSCFDANGGVFEVFFREGDAIISDELNHASIIDGIRLSRATRYRYRNGDLADLESRLVESASARRRIIVTDGVFSMDGGYAPLPGICELADRFDALVMVDDSHAVGVVGRGGRGTPELFGVAERVDLYSGTFGKALGGASGGYVSGRSHLIELLRQRARPYLFSNSLAPSVVAGATRALELLDECDTRRMQLRANSETFRSLMAAEGFHLLGGGHPIVPVLIGDAERAAAMSAALLERGIYAVAFSYPVVPKGEARIRIQLSSDHTQDDIESAVSAFVAAREDARVG